jgi:hypothetical protein
VGRGWQRRLGADFGSKHDRWSPTPRVDVQRNARSEDASGIFVVLISGVRLGWASLGGQGERKGEGAALTLCTLDPDPPPVCLDCHLVEREPEPRPRPLARLDLAEFFKNRIQKLLWNTYPLSATSISASSSSIRARNVMVPPRPVCLTAFSSRLDITR